MKTKSKHAVKLTPEERARFAADMKACPFCGLTAAQQTGVTNFSGYYECSDCGRRWRYAPAKYNAKPVFIDGIRFMSRAEGARYCELTRFQKMGCIRNLTLQPSFNVLDRAGKKIFTYKADFDYDSQDGHIVEDVKGLKTPMYRLKKKLIEDKYDIEITEVKMTEKHIKKAFLDYGVEL